MKSVYWMDGTMETGDQIIYVNDGYTRDLDERKDTEIVVADRDNVKANYNIPQPMMAARRRRFYRTFAFWLNAAIFVAIVAFIILHELNFLPHFHSGFYCNDPILSFRFEGDTISISLLLAISSILPLVTILLNEVFRCRPEKYSFSNVRFKTAFKNTYVWYGEYLLSLLFNLFFMEVMKGIIGEPRPHFLETCKPDTAANCTPGEYIPKYTCTGTKQSHWFIMDTIKSFPSGHTSLSILMSMFLFCYFQKRCCDLQPRLMGPLLQMASIAWCIVCSLTRITDHRHHWWDVLAGAVLGFAMSYHLVWILCKNFACSKPPHSRNTTPNGDSGVSVDNHNSVKRFMNSSCVRQENFESGLRQIT